MTIKELKKYIESLPKEVEEVEILISDTSGLAGCGEISIELDKRISSSPTHSPKKVMYIVPNFA